VPIVLEINNWQRKSDESGNFSPALLSLLFRKSVIDIKINCIVSLSNIIIIYNTQNNCTLFNFMRRPQIFDVITTTLKYLGILFLKLLLPTYK